MNLPLNPLCVDLRISWQWVRLASITVKLETFTEVWHSRAKIGRQTLGRELATIADYRLRLNQYRTDVSLRDAHQKGPWITVW